MKLVDPLPGGCRHYHTEAALKRTTCKAGLWPREVVGGEARGWRLRAPCTFGENASVSCQKFERLTEADQHERQSRMAEAARTFVEQLTNAGDQSTDHKGEEK